MEDDRPFREKHPDFQRWLSVISLIVAALALLLKLLK
jgi:uncharacterized protein involved in cysteine biosynthesis